MKARKAGTLVLAAAMMITAMMTSARLTAADSVSVGLGNKDKGQCAIVYPAGEALSERIAGKLADYIQTHAGWKPAVSADDKFADAGQPLIVLDGTNDLHVAAKFGQKMEVKSADRDEAFILKTATHSNRPVIIAVGKTAKGAKYAVYELMLRQFEFGDGGAVTAPAALNIERAPFIKNRYLELFYVLPGAEKPWQKYFSYKSMPLEWQLKMVDMYDYYGLSGITVGDYYAHCPERFKAFFALSHDEHVSKMKKVVERLHDNGQKFGIRQWGNAFVYDDNGIVPEGSQAGYEHIAWICPSTTAGRLLWNNLILEYYTKTWGTYIDNFVGHWGDAGGCPMCMDLVKKGQKPLCTFDMAIQLHNEMRAAFKKINPNIETSFNTWALTHWPKGTYGNNPRAYKGILAKDVIIADRKPPSDPDDFRSATWRWYTADHEIDPTLVVSVSRLATLYENGGGDQNKDEWQDIERNLHRGANTVNYYAMGRYMWEPSRKPAEVMREFTTLAFGKDNSEKIARAYEAIETLRNGPRFDACVAIKRGSESLAARMAREAIEGLDTAVFFAGFRPRLEVEISPQEIIKQLRENLVALKEIAVIMADTLPKTREALRKGDPVAAKTELKRLSDQIKKWPAMNEAKTAEGAWLGLAYNRAKAHLPEYTGFYEALISVEQALQKGDSASAKKALTNAQSYFDVGDGGVGNQPGKKAGEKGKNNAWRGKSAMIDDHVNIETDDSAEKVDTSKSEKNEAIAILKEYEKKVADAEEK